MFRIRFILLIVGCTVAGASLAADTAPAELGAPNGPQEPKSVMVRHSSAAATDPSASPARMVDKAVRPASGTEPLTTVAAADSAKAAGDGTDAASAAASQAATDLLNHALQSPKNSPLAGHALTLLQAMGPFASNRNSQLAIARAYWKLSAAQGDYNWAVEEADQLDHIPTGTGAVDSTVMATARASTQARLLEAKLGAVTAQQELADLLAIPASSPLPLAADPPLVGAYRTYFETLYSGRVAPPRMRLIDRTLPIRREAIETHVAAVQAAASAVHAADDARAKGGSDLQNLLLRGADLSRQRRLFLAAVRDYNFDIAEYALTVAEPSVPTERVIGMLIRTKPSAPPATSVVPPAAGGAAIVQPSVNDPLLRPASPPASRPNPATGPPGSGSAPTPLNPVGSASGAAAATGPSKATGTTNPLAPTNPATVENPFARDTPSGPAAPVTPVPAGPNGAPSR
jgi:hypothetical protein